MSDPVVLMAEMETEILKKIITDIFKGDIGSAAWQAQKLQSRGRLNNQLRKLIEKGTKESIEVVETMLSKEAITNTNIIDRQVKQAGWSGTLPNDADEMLKTVLTSWDKIAAQAINQTGSNLLAAANQAYIDIVDKAVAGVLAGEKTGAEAIKEASRQFGKSGLKAIRDKAGREWSVEAYMQTVVRSNVRNVTTEIQRERTKQWGIDLIEIDSHIGARPGCAPYQGKIFSLSGENKNYPAFSETTYGEVDGLFGINCGHNQYPFFPGSKKTYEPYGKKENEKNYKESQRQRAIERNIRRYKRELELAKIRNDTKIIESAKKGIARNKAIMQNFIDETNRTRRYSRERVY